MILNTMCTCMCSSLVGAFLITVMRIVFRYFFADTLYSEHTLTSTFIYLFCISFNAKSLEREQEIEISIKQTTEHI